MKRLIAASLISAASVLLLSTSVFAQSEYEVTCRAQAKEIALQTYQTCVTEGRQARIKEIRDSYKGELAEVKAKYEKLLQEMNGASKQGAPNTGKPASGKSETSPTETTSGENSGMGASAAPLNPAGAAAIAGGNSSAPAAKRLRRRVTPPNPARIQAEKPVAGIAQKLPVKQNSGPALSVQNEGDSETVVISKAPDATDSTGPEPEIVNVPPDRY